MPLQTKAIKQKIKSVGSIKKITKTMELVSISKMRRSVDKALSSRNYSRYALELLINISKNKEITHPLMLAPEKAKKELIIVIASNKGMCGGYHTNLFKALNLYMKKKEGLGKEIKAITIGKYAEKISKKLAISNFAGFNTFSEHSSIEQTKELSDLISNEFKKGEYKSIKILYTEFLKSTTYKPVLREIFPISVDTIENILEIIVPAPAEELLEKDSSKNEVGVTEKEKSKIVSFDFTDYKFEPDLNAILESVLPGLIDIVVYQTLAEAFASEHSARMFAMKNAGDNATTILNGLMLSYNHARQDGITRELSEIVAGAEALSTN